MEIRFRVWDGEKMWYPNDAKNWVLYQNGALIKTADSDEISFSSDRITMLSTGLKDKNGKEIWEGDIVRHVVEGVKSESLCEVVWREGHCALRCLCDNVFDYLWIYSAILEYVGNIHENPELLEVA